MKRATIIMLVAGMALSGMQQAYGNWFARLIGIERPQPTQQVEPTKGDMRRVR